MEKIIVNDISLITNYTEFVQCIKDCNSEYHNDPKRAVARDRLLTTLHNTPENYHAWEKRMRKQFHSQREF